MNRPRVVRCLWVLFSASCLTACVLLVALWVLSYWQFELVLVRLSTSSDVRIVSSRGQVAFCISAPGGALGITTAFRIAPNAYLTSVDSSKKWVRGAIDSGLGKHLQRNFTPNRLLVTFGGADGRIVIVPFWVLVLSSVSLATVSLFKRHLSWQFSLRTLLVATTLVAVVLGTIAYQTKARKTPSTDAGDVEDPYRPSIFR